MTPDLECAVKRYERVAGVCRRRNGGLRTWL